LPEGRFIWEREIKDTDVPPEKRLSFSRQHVVLYCNTFQPFVDMNYFIQKNTEGEPETETDTPSEPVDNTEAINKA